MSRLRYIFADRRAQYVLLVAGVLLAGAVFVTRTLGQPQYEPCDFAAYYTSARAWLLSEDPYDRAAAVRVWEEAGGRPDIMPDGTPDAGGITWMPIIQLPTALPVFAPLALLPAGAAVRVFYVTCVVLLLAQTAALAHLAHSALWRQRGLMLLIVTLLFAPVHDLFGWGQPSVPAISFIVLSVWAASYRRDVAAGILLALATAVKPQLGGLFVAYYVLTGRWRLAGTVAALGAALLLAAMVPLHLHGHDRFAGWHENFLLAHTPGGLNSTTPDNPDRYYFLHLPVVLHAVVASESKANALAVVITAGLAVLFGQLRRRAREHHREGEDEDELLWVSIVAIMALLPVYHRFYDAGLMLVPTAWALGHLRRAPRLAWPVLVLAMSFVVPVRITPRLAEVLIGKGLPLVGSRWWHLLIDPWRTWVMLACLVLLFRAAGPGEWVRLRATVTDVVQSITLAVRRRRRRRRHTPEPESDPAPSPSSR